MSFESVVALLTSIPTDATEVTLTFLKDCGWEKVEPFRSYPALLPALICFIGFLCGLPFICEAGVYWFELVDSYVALFVVFLIGAAECLAVSYLYGSSRLAFDVEQMTGKKVGSLASIRV